MGMYHGVSVARTAQGSPDPRADVQRRRLRARRSGRGPLAADLRGLPLRPLDPGRRGRRRARRSSSWRPIDSPAARRGRRARVGAQPGGEVGGARAPRSSTWAATASRSSCCRPGRGPSCWTPPAAPRRPASRPPRSPPITTRRSRVPRWSPTSTATACSSSSSSAGGGTRAASRRRIEGARTPSRWAGQGKLDHVPRQPVQDRNSRAALTRGARHRMRAGVVWSRCHGCGSTHAALRHHDPLRRIRSPARGAHPDDPARARHGRAGRRGHQLGRVAGAPSRARHHAVRGSLPDRGQHPRRDERRRLRGRRRHGRRR